MYRSVTALPCSKTKKKSVPLKLRNVQTGAKRAPQETGMHPVKLVSRERMAPILPYLAHE